MKDVLQTAAVFTSFAAVMGAVAGAAAIFASLFSMALV